jgi:hypothetical protein
LQLSMERFLTLPTDLCGAVPVPLGEDTQRDVAKALGYRDASSVGKQRQALSTKLAEAPTLKRRMTTTMRELMRLHS